jgi:ABC-2 type transport system ATP-binding protein
MEEADYLCGRIAIMDHGKFVALDTPARLKDVLGGDVVSLEIEGESAPIAAFESALKALDWIKKYHRHDDVLNLTMEKGERRIPELVNLAQEHGVTVSCVHLRKPSLEDVFLHFTGRSIREQDANVGERNRAMMMGHGRR